MQYPPKWTNCECILISELSPYPTPSKNGTLPMFLMAFSMVTKKWHSGILHLKFCPHFYSTHVPFISINSLVLHSCILCRVLNARNSSVQICKFVLPSYLMNNLNNLKWIWTAFQIKLNGHRESHVNKSQLLNLIMIRERLWSRQGKLHIKKD
jgi:hypothetical protein